MRGHGCFTGTGPRLLGRVCALAALSSAVAAAPAAAGAATLPASCATLQSQIQLASETPGSTVVLTGMCDAAALGSETGIRIPAGSSFTLEGAAGTTSGLDGAGVTATMLATGEGRRRGRAR